MRARILRLLLLPLLLGMTLLASPDSGISGSPSRDAKRHLLIATKALSETMGVDAMTPGPDGEQGGVRTEEVGVLAPGDGIFGPSYDVLTGLSGHSSYLAVGDLNSDGKPDIVAGSSEASAVAVLLGNGDGTFLTPHVPYPVAVTGQVL